MSNFRYAFAGDRDVSVSVLKHLLKKGTRPSALFVSAANKSSHSEDLKMLCNFLDEKHVLIGKNFREPDSVEIIKKLDVDYIICIHFPYLIPEKILSIPRIGVLNLHPAYLPFNRGWHTPSWAILENTPIGATLHFMDSDIDTGDIVHRKKLTISPSDTAHTLYQKLKSLELEVFIEAWPKLIKGDFTRTLQGAKDGTTHCKTDLFSQNIQKIELNNLEKSEDLINRLRALTTNRLNEAAYFVKEGRRYRLQISIHEEKTTQL